MVFALNSIVFLSVGLEVRFGALVASWKPIVVAWLAVMLGRAAVIAAMRAVLSRTKERIPASWTPVLAWGGLRGALSMVLALGLPNTFPHRELIVNMTFGVVLLSILVQGLTMAPLLSRLGLSSVRHDRHEYERRRGALLAASAGLSTLERMQHGREVPPDVLDPLLAEYAERVSAADARVHELHLEHGVLLTEQTEALRRQLLNVEKDELLRARRLGAINDEAFESLAAEIDGRLHRLDWGDGPNTTTTRRPAAKSPEDGPPTPT